MDKIKKIVFSFLAFFSFVMSLFISTTVARYASSVTANTDVGIAKPIIEIVNLSDTNISNLDNSNQEISFDVVNYDGNPMEISEVLLQYRISFRTLKNLPIYYTLYRVDSLGTRHLLSTENNVSEKMMMDHGIMQTDSFVLVVKLDDVNYKDTTDKVIIEIQAEQINFDNVFRSSLVKKHVNSLPINLEDEVEYLNYINEDLHYDIEISNPKFTLSVLDGAQRILEANQQGLLSDNLIFTIDLDVGEVASSYEEINLTYSVTQPFNFQKTISIIYDTVPPYNYSPTITPLIDSIDISGTAFDYATLTEDLIYYYKIDGGEFVRGSSSYSFLNLIADHEYEISVKIEDEAGNNIVFVQNVTTLSYVTDGLILRFDGIKNTRIGNNPAATYWEDLSGNGNDGLVVRATYDSVRKAYRFYGSTVAANARSSINIPNTFYTTLPATVEIVAATGTTPGIMYYDSSGQIAIGYFDTQNGLVTTGPNKTSQRLFSLAGTPFHSGNPFTLTVNYTNQANTLRTAFVNNLELSELTAVNYWGGDSSMNYIGRRANDAYPYEGYIYAIRIYNRVLTPEERYRNYKSDQMRFGYIE